MTHIEDLIRLKNFRIEAMEEHIEKLQNRIEYLESVLEVARETTFKN